MSDQEHQESPGAVPNESEAERQVAAPSLQGEAREPAQAMEPVTDGLEGVDGIAHKSAPESAKADSLPVPAGEHSAQAASDTVADGSKHEQQGTADEHVDGQSSATAEHAVADGIHVAAEEPATATTGEADAPVHAGAASPSASPCLDSADQAHTGEAVEPSEADAADVTAQDEAGHIEVDHPAATADISASATAPAEEQAPAERVAAHASTEGQEPAESADVAAKNAQGPPEEASVPAGGKGDGPAAPEAEEESSETAHDTGLQPRAQESAHMPAGPEVAAEMPAISDRAPVDGQATSAEQPGTVAPPGTPTAEAAASSSLSASAPPPASDPEPLHAADDGVAGVEAEADSAESPEPTATAVSGTSAGAAANEASAADASPAADMPADEQPHNEFADAAESHEDAGEPQLPPPPPPAPFAHEESPPLAHEESPPLAGGASPPPEGAPAEEEQEGKALAEQDVPGASQGREKGHSHEKEEEEGFQEAAVAEGEEEQPEAVAPESPVGSASCQAVAVAAPIGETAAAGGEAAEEAEDMGNEPVEDEQFDEEPVGTEASGQAADTAAKQLEQPGHAASTVDDHKVLDRGHASQHKYQHDDESVIGEDEEVECLAAPGDGQADQPLDGEEEELGDQEFDDPEQSGNGHQAVVRGHTVPSHSDAGSGQVTPGSYHNDMQAGSGHGSMHGDDFISQGEASTEDSYPELDPKAITAKYIELLQAGQLKRPSRPGSLAPIETAAAGHGRAHRSGSGSASAPATPSGVSASGASGGGGGGGRVRVSGPGLDGLAASVFAPELARLQMQSQRQVGPIGSHRLPANYSAQHIHQYAEQQQQQLSATFPRSSKPSISHGSAGPRSPRSGPGVRATSAQSPTRIVSPNNLEAHVRGVGKAYAPGPGAYTPATLRSGVSQRLGGSVFGTTAFSPSFGTARQRPHNVCGPVYAESPGPVYLPHRNFTSTTPAAANVKFPTRFMGSRFDLNAEKFSNSPHYSPAPGNYDPVVTPKGACLPPGDATPKHAFPCAVKQPHPKEATTSLPIISKAHAVRSQYGVHSPGPGTYEPDVSPTRRSPPKQSMAPKAASYFDVFMDPSRQPSPGPVYLPKERDRWGRTTIGEGPHATFPRSPKAYEPQLHLSQTVFLTENHAQHVNKGVHSPGPVYFPKDIGAGYVPSPVLGSGSADRFYTRAEPGRL